MTSFYIDREEKNEVGGKAANLILTLKITFVILS
jgi:hypothetical protein